MQNALVNVPNGRLELEFWKIEPREYATRDVSWKRKLENWRSKKSQGVVTPCNLPKQQKKFRLIFTWRSPQRWRLVKKGKWKCKSDERKRHCVWCVIHTWLKRGALSMCFLNQVRSSRRCEGLMAGDVRFAFSTYIAGRQQPFINRFTRNCAAYKT